MKPAVPQGGTGPAILRRLTTVELKIVAREIVAVVFSLVFPAALLLILGSVMPGFRDPEENLGGLRPVDIYGPVVIGLALATAAFSMLPAYLAQYRENGVLRRLATTPASPSALLGAQMIVHGGLMVGGSILALLSATVVFGVDWPGNVVALVGVFVLSTVACFALGLVLAAVAKNARVANGLGMVVYFPMLFFAGVWTPGDAMPDVVRAVADFTPLGAASEAMADAWINGTWPAVLHVLVLVGWAAIGGVAAAKLFRWN